MSGPADWREELKILCEAAVEDRLTADQLHRLEQLVLENPEARQYYVEHLHLHACLHWAPANAERGPRDGKPKVIHRSSLLTRRSALIGGLLAASVMFVVWLAWPKDRTTLATLVPGKGCKWDGGSLPTEEGAKLGVGRLRLAEGVARVVFHSGAEVTLEAPAELELVSSKRCILHDGRLVAKVPEPAIGFTVDTPTAVLEDRGTEFGVHVRDGQADVQVFNGMVEVRHHGSGKAERLMTGKNRRFGPDTVADFDPQAEGPIGPTLRPVDAGARVYQISSAMGRGRDAYVQPLFPSPTNSSDVLLLVKNSLAKSPDYLRKAYIGLDLAPLAGTKILEAQLAFTMVPTGMGFASEVPDATFVVYGLTDESLDDWDEKAIRWQNAPANRPGGAEVDPARTVRLGTFQAAQGVQKGTRTISGQALVDFLNRDTNSLATFILVRETPGSGRCDLVHGFAGKNHPTLPPPTLKVTARPP